MNRPDACPMNKPTDEYAGYRRSRGYWHRVFSVTSLVLLDVVFLVMLDRIFVNSKDEIIRSSDIYVERIQPHFKLINEESNRAVSDPRPNETVEQYEERFTEFFRKNADRYLTQNSPLYRITIFGSEKRVIFDRSNLSKFRQWNNWRNCFLSRNFSRAQIRTIPFPDRGFELVVWMYYTSPVGWPEIEHLVLRFWGYALAFVITTLVFYLWLNRRLIVPLGRVAGHLEQLATEGTVQIIRQPRVDIEAAYNRLAETQREVRLEMELDRLVESYQQYDEVPADEMSHRLLRDIPPAIGECFALTAVSVKIPEPDTGGWEPMGTWTRTAPVPTIQEPSDFRPEEIGRVSIGDTNSAWWIIPFRLEEQRAGLIFLLDDEGSLQAASAQRIRRLVENSLLRCAGFSRRLAEERNRFSVNLATSMGHDLTNIIAGGKWDLNTIHRALNSGAVRLDPARADVLLQAFEGLKNNLQFLQEMVDIYRALGAARAPCYERGDVGSYLHEVCELFIRSTSQRLEVIQDISSNCEAIIEPRLLKMAVFNLLANAAHAIQRREDGLVGGRIEVQLRCEGDHIVFIVRDNGPGIRDHTGRLLDEKEIGRIFRVGYSTKGSGSGGGLGLVWVKNIVEEFHQGTIRAANRPEGGAEITIRFPRESEVRRIV